MKKIQVYRKIEPQDKTVIEALEIAKNFKVLPYSETVKRLEKIAYDYSTLKVNK